MNSDHLLQNIGLVVIYLSIALFTGWYAIRSEHPTFGLRLAVVAVAFGFMLLAIVHALLTASWSLL